MNDSLKTLLIIAFLILRQRTDTFYALDLGVFHRINPSTGAVAREVVLATQGEVEAAIDAPQPRRFALAEADTCVAPGFSAVTLRNARPDAPAFVFIADESPLHRKLGLLEQRD